MLLAWLTSILQKGTPLRSWRSQGRLQKLCRDAGHTPEVLGAGKDLPLDQACAREMQLCRLQGQHKLVISLGETAVAMGLDLPEDHFTEQVKGGNSILRVLHYPPAPDAPADAPRAGSHEDINLITLLVGSSADGLEVLDMDGDWIPVRAHSQHLTVNVGDMLQNFTGGVLRSTTHRVVLPEGEGRSKSRFSLPFFLHPQGSMPLDPVMGDREAHPCWTAEAFLNHRLKEIGLS